MKKDGMKVCQSDGVVAQAKRASEGNEITEVEVGSTEVSLRCPLMYNRIKVRTNLHGMK